MPIPLADLHAIVRKFMPAAQWSRHSCLLFNKLFDVIARRGLASDFSHFHG